MASSHVQPLSSSTGAVEESDVTGPISDVLQFWFGEAAKEPLKEFEGTSGEARALDLLKNQGLWFRKSEATDEEMKSKFLHLIQQAKEGKLATWEDTPKGALALIIILDQFSRNVFRGLPASFESDPEALRIAQRAVEKGFDSILPPPMREFMYMPFMHSEDLGVSAKGVDLFTEAAARVQDQRLKDSAANTAKFMKMHWDVIARFGRFPHRNPILGRESTKEELEYMESGGGF